MAFGPNSATFWTIFGLFLALTFAVSVLFDRVITWLKQHGYDEGYVSLEVVFGVGYTLAAATLFLWLVGADLLPVLVLVAFFAASGLPMIVGDIARYVMARKAETRQ